MVLLCGPEEWCWSTSLMCVLRSYHWTMAACLPLFGCLVNRTFVRAPLVGPCFGGGGVSLPNEESHPIGYCLVMRGEVLSSDIRGVFKYGIDCIVSDVEKFVQGFRTAGIGPMEDALLRYAGWWNAGAESPAAAGGGGAAGTRARVFAVVKRWQGEVLWAPRDAVQGRATTAPLDVDRSVGRDRWAR